MNSSVNEVAKLCENVQQISQGTIDWLKKDSSKKIVGQRYESLLRQMRQSARQADRLKNASISPVSIAVYGASQAGKSFLVAHLAAPPNPSGGSTSQHSAMVLPHARKGAIPFLDINPTGGRESTGLVTRFTARNLNADPDYPIFIKLLTVLDLIKILSNCYFIDMDQSDEIAIDGSEIESLLASLQNGRSKNSGLISDDIYELKEYFRSFRHLRNNTEVLDASQYWERLSEVVNTLDVDDLLRILSPLWGKVEGFSAIFKRLYSALSSLSFASDINCGIDSLIPRVDPKQSDKALTIIDVDTLKRLLNEEHEPLAVKSTSGQITLDRTQVTALAAELVLNLSGEKREFLDNTDLLDFPGARARGGTRRSKLDEPGEVESVFLRGKVAHLFDRYRDEYDLTSMILCVGDSTQEVTTLPKLINDWVEKTHGETPGQRQKSDTALFLVLTKFDRQFNSQAGEQMSMSDRWVNRLNATIGGFLAKDGNWAREWRPNEPFNNIFWYRNPFYGQTHLFDYKTIGDAKTETALRSDVITYVEEMKSHYLSAEPVKKHFSDPIMAWDSVFKLNDGGISYLSDAITIISKKNVKVGQIKSRIGFMAEQIKTDLSQYYYDSDPTIQLRIRQEKAESFLSEIEECFGRGQFSRLLFELQIADDELAQVYRAVRLRDGYSTESSSQRQPGRLLDIALGRSSTAINVNNNLDCEDTYGRKASLEERYACRVMSSWQDKVDRMCQNYELIKFMGLSQDGIQFLASEVSAGSRRLNLARQISDQAKEYVNFRQTSSDMGAWSPALMGASIINDYIVNLGVINTSTNAENRDWPLLDETPGKPDETFCVSWMKRFHSFVTSNAATGESGNFDRQQNDVLGSILKRAADIG
jgi:hypothetical protein